jgi:metallo-beta-lactamase class B
MNDEYYRTSKVLTPDLHKRFLEDVDIALPSHPNQIEILDRAGTYTDELQPFLDKSVWRSFIRERGRQVREYDPIAIKAMIS